MQTLLIDLGNSCLKWALAEGGQRTAAASLSHRGQALSPLLDKAWQDIARPGRIIVASVSGSDRQSQLTDWLRRHWSRQAEFIVSPAQGHGVMNSYTEPARLGCDRWCAMIAAYGAQQGPVCVVDCGSAVTLDVIEQGGRHLGGYILPGVRSMHTALTQQTSLAPVDLESAAGTFLGNSTQAAIVNGITHAISALVQQTLQVLKHDRDISAQCYLTGGDASIIGPLLHVPYILVPDLVLQGLAIMAADT